MDVNTSVLKEALQMLDLDTLVVSLLALFLLYGIATATRAVGEALSRTFSNARLTISQAFTILNFLVYTVGLSGIVVLIIKPPDGLLLAMGGSAAVAIGFALKDLASSVVAGLIVIFDRPFRVGDRVAFQDFYGDIVSIGLRSVRLTTLTDDTVTIPNNLFLTQAISSGNAGSLDMLVACKFHVPLDADLDQVRELLYEIVVTSRFVFLEKPVTITVEQVEAAHQMLHRLTTKAYVKDVKFEKAFVTDLTVRGARAFREREVPFPKMNPSP